KKQARVVLRKINEAYEGTQQFTKEYEQAAKENRGAYEIGAATQHWWKLVSQNPIYFTLYSFKGLLDGVPVVGELFNKLETEYWNIKLGRAHTVWGAPVDEVADWKAKQLFKTFVGQSFWPAANNFLEGFGLKEEVAYRDDEGRIRGQVYVWKPVHRVLTAIDHSLAKIESATEIKPKDRQRLKETRQDFINAEGEFWQKRRQQLKEAKGKKVPVNEKWPEHIRLNIARSAFEGARNRAKPWREDLTRIFLDPKGLRKKLRKAEEKDPISALLYLAVSLLFHFTTGLITRIVGEFLEKAGIAPKIRAVLNKIGRSDLFQTAKLGGAAVRDMVKGFFSWNTVAGGFLGAVSGFQLGGVLGAQVFGLLGGVAGGFWQGLLNLSKDEAGFKWTTEWNRTVSAYQGSLSDLRGIESQLNTRFYGEIEFAKGEMKYLRPEARVWDIRLGTERAQMEAMIGKWKTFNQAVKNFEATLGGRFTKIFGEGPLAGTASLVKRGLSALSWGTLPGPLRNLASLIKTHPGMKAIFPFKGLAATAILYQVLPMLGLPVQLAFIPVGLQIAQAVGEELWKYGVPQRVKDFISVAPWRGGLLGGTLGFLIASMAGISPVVGAIVGGVVGAGLEMGLKAISGPAGKVMQFIGKVAGSVFNVAAYAWSFEWLEQIGGLAGVLASGLSLNTGLNVLGYAFRLGAAWGTGTLIGGAIGGIGGCIAGFMMGGPIGCVGGAAGGAKLGGIVFTGGTIAIDLSDSLFGTNFGQTIYNNLFSPAISWITTNIGPILSSWATTAVNFFAGAALSVAGMVMGVLGFLMSLTQIFSAKKLEDMAAPLIMAAVSLAMIGTLFMQIVIQSAFVWPWTRTEMLGEVFLMGSEKAPYPAGESL
ncbi:MAG: hypothetical protein Q8N98_04430, partial [bacterium]|nr:hypothetical protein [bacterium]